MNKDALSPALRAITESFDSVPHHIVIADTTGAIVYANAAAEKHTGFTGAEMLGKKPGELWGGLMSGELYDEMWKVINDQKIAFVADVQNHTKDGKKFWQELHILPVINVHGTAEYYIGVELDLNEEHRRQELITEYRKHSPEVEKDVQIRWPVGWLLEAGHLTSQQMLELQEQYASEGSLDHLVEDLVAVSDVTYSSTLPNRDFSVTILVDDVIRDVRTRFPRITFHQLSEGSVDISLRENAQLLHEVLLRLITNAAQYASPATGEVRVTVLTDDHVCVIKCEDNGIGISYQDQKRMYDKFFRGADARRINPGGSGLGLHLVHCIATVRGWKVTCTSEPKKGTLFTVEIPIV
ncbi:MAG: PAS domain-containing sensor histidine kinase [Candidatus Peregrinibacteria bacterium]